MKKKVKIGGKTFRFKVDKSLDKYENVVLFPEKLKRANEKMNRPGMKEKIEKVMNSEL